MLGAARVTGSSTAPGQAEGRGAAPRARHLAPVPAHHIDGSLPDRAVHPERGIVTTMTPSPSRPPSQEPIPVRAIRLRLLAAIVALGGRRGRAAHRDPAAPKRARLARLHQRPRKACDDTTSTKEDHQTEARRRGLPRRGATAHRLQQLHVFAASSARTGSASGGSAGLGTTIYQPVPAGLRRLPLTNQRGQRVDLASWQGGRCCWSRS